MRILFVKDDQYLAEAVVVGLQEEGDVVDHAPTGADARLPNGGQPADGPQPADGGQRSDGAQPGGNMQRSGL